MHLKILLNSLVILTAGTHVKVHLTLKFSHEIYSLQKLTLKVLVVTIDAQWEGMGDVGSARYEPALLPPCPTIKVLSYSN